MTIGRNIIEKPLITEKSIQDAQRGVYTFRVDKHANKVEIGKEIEKLYQVNVVSVTTQIVKGKEKTAGKKRQKTRLSDWKKTRVKLKKGQKIEVFDIGGQKL